MQTKDTPQVKEVKNFELTTGTGDKCFHILVYLRDEILPIRVDRVLMAYAENGFRFITTKEATFIVSYSLNELGKMLGNLHFRINRQYIISYQIISKIYFKENTKLNIELREPFNQNLLVSKRKSTNFREWLTNPFKTT